MQHVPQLKDAERSQKTRQSPLLSAIASMHTHKVAKHFDLYCTEVSALRKRKVAWSAKSKNGLSSSCARTEVQIDDMK